MINEYETPQASRSNRCILKIYEDVPGGCVIQKSELKNGSSGYLNEGILISIDSSGIGHLCKTAMAWDNIESSATGIKCYPQNEFKVGDILTDTSLTVPGRYIQSVDRSNVSFDLFSIASGFGFEIPEGSVLIEALASGINASFKYSPDGIGISEFPINLQYANTGFGLLVRGSVRENLMPYFVDSNIKALLPLIRFV